MALKSFTKLSSRNRGSIVSQIHKLMKMYGDFFCVRERAYLRNLSNTDGTIYWIPEGANNLVAMAIIEPDFTFTINDYNFHSIGYLISKKPGFINRVLQHIWSDFEDENLILFSKPSLAERIPPSEFGLIECTPDFLQENCPELANQVTSYFSIPETLAEGLRRRGYNAYFKFSAGFIADNKLKNTDFFTKLSSK